MMKQMNLKAAYQKLLILLFLLPIAVTGQISRGGSPIQIQKLNIIAIKKIK